MSVEEACVCVSKGEQQVSPASYDLWFNRFEHGDKSNPYSGAVDSHPRGKISHGRIGKNCVRVVDCDQQAGSIMAGRTPTIDVDSSSLNVSCGPTE